MKRVRAGVVLTAAVLAACSSTPRQGDEAASSAGSGAPLRASEPYVQLTGGTSGYLVWPSGSAWLVLYTSDGFRQVSNRTPLAIDTEGGLVGEELEAPGLVGGGQPFQEKAAEQA